MDISSVILRTPTAADGFAVNHLINNIPELDSNSCYCNLLQCSHFSETSILAEYEGQVVGFISGYHKPQSSGTLFVWQVAVSSKARGCGLATRMLLQLLASDGNRSVSHVETTITEDNAPSWALFTRLSKQCNAPLERALMFDRAEHFNDQHASEFLVRIGPLHR
ncbi:diaminobutyrate acetyltransferase [Amphritea pacifica]|uniref:L-2,4-diaminobutyric acid acetyltransferase n=1 Tax=Amphritea pacifica TaxID=2811233 RepID=A0ABS2WA04_9GAMM|nr:diaminobutyrate acetyltransferase [Amphritea pacifica]MBN0988509.1 diaminobutyrate acetyltransferase [Amphritea pacifica]MBN1008382.1 diaminobutyrate acetyltransferase [Amphritea pacifica]